MKFIDEIYLRHKSFWLSALGFTVILGGGLSFYSFRPFHLIGILLLPYFIFRIRPFWTEAKWGSRLDGLFWAFAALWFGLSLAWVQELSLGVKALFYLFNAIYILLLLLLLIENRQDFKKVFWGASSALGLNFLIGLVEATTGWRWLIGRLSSWNVAFGVDRQYQYYLTDLQNRRELQPEVYDFLIHQPSGFNWGPNQFGLVLCLALPFLLLLFKRRSFWLVALFSVVFLTHMVASRSIMVGVVLGLILTVALQWKSLSYPRKGLLFGLAILLPAWPFLMEMAKGAKAIPAPAPPIHANVELPEQKQAQTKELEVAESRPQEAKPVEAPVEKQVIDERASKLENTVASVTAYLSPESYKSVVTNVDDPFLINEAVNETAEVDGSVSKRKIMLVKAWKQFLEHPLRGVGIGSSAQHAGMHFGKTQIHNYWAELLFEGGSFFFALFLGWISFVLFRLTRLRSRLKSHDDIGYRLVSAMLISLLVLVPSALAVGTLAYQMTAWFVLGLSLAALKIGRAESHASN